MDRPTRRKFLQLSTCGFRQLVVTMGALGIGSLVSHAEGKPGQPAPNKDSWMRQLMRDPKLKASDSPLHLGRFREPMYYLLDSISWEPNANQAGKFKPVDVPKGFVTDLASIPRAFWSLLRPDGTYAYAAIIHDYLYWEQPQPREVADQIFKQSMEDFEINSGTISTIFAAVRVAGQSSWDQNARLKAAGEKRVLSVPPPNARTQWSVWKRRPDVFVP